MRSRHASAAVDNVFHDLLRNAACIANRYSADDMSGKALCKRALQREMRLEPDPNVPLIGFIGRLDYQKGPDLVLDALPFLSNLDCQVQIMDNQASWMELRGIALLVTNCRALQAHVDLLTLWSVEFCLTVAGRCPFGLGQPSLSSCTSTGSCPV